MPRHRTTGRKLKTNFWWERFDARRTSETGGDITCLLTHVNLTIPPKSTHKDVLEAITQALQPPLAIEFLSEELSKTATERGRTIFDPQRRR